MQVSFILATTAAGTTGMPIAGVGAMRAVTAERPAGRSYGEAAGAG